MPKLGKKALDSALDVGERFVEKEIANCELTILLKHEDHKESIGTILRGEGARETDPLHGINAPKGRESLRSGAHLAELSKKREKSLIDYNIHGVRTPLLPFNRART
jgi:hypothetical protein